MSRHGIDLDRSAVADRVLPRRAAGSTCQFRRTAEAQTAVHVVAA